MTATLCVTLMSVFCVILSPKLLVWGTLAFLSFRDKFMVFLVFQIWFFFSSLLGHDPTQLTASYEPLLPLSLLYPSLLLLSLHLLSNNFILQSLNSFVTFFLISFTLSSFLPIPILSLYSLLSFPIFLFCPTFSSFLFFPRPSSPLLSSPLFSSPLLSSPPLSSPLFSCSFIPHLLSIGNSNSDSSQTAMKMYNSFTSFLAKSPHYIMKHIHQREENQIAASQSLSSLSSIGGCVQREEQHTVGSHTVQRHSMKWGF